MGKFFVENETVRISFPDGEWIDLKEELSQEDQDFILNQLAQFVQTDDESEKKDEKDGQKSHMQINLGKLALLQRSIVAWSFKDGDKPVPVDREHISKLRLCYREPSLNKIDKLNEHAAEFRKN